MRCGFCQPASEHDSSLRNERCSFRNDELHQKANWQNLPTCVAPGLEGRLVLASVRYKTIPAYATHHAVRHWIMLLPPILRQSRYALALQLRF